MGRIKKVAGPKHEATIVSVFEQTKTLRLLTLTM